MTAYLIQQAHEKLLILARCEVTSQEVIDITHGRPVEVVEHELNREIWLLQRSRKCER